MLLRPIALAGILCLAGAAAQAAQQDFTLYNVTGYTIDKVFVSSVGQNSWGSDLMGSGQLEDGKKVDVSFNEGGRGCNYDLKVVYDDEDTAEWGNVNLCELSKIHLHWDKKAGTTTATSD
jgi:hypothetical protein